VPVKCNQSCYVNPKLNFTNFLKQELYTKFFTAISVLCIAVGVDLTKMDSIHPKYFGITSDSIFPTRLYAA
jgi:hypothetical protein